MRFGLSFVSKELLNNMPTTSHITAAGVVALDDLLITDRTRKDTADNRAWIENTLLPSISTFGLIQPITVDQHEERTGKNIFGKEAKGTLTLTAGWSRTFAFSLLKEPVIPYAYSVELPLPVRRAQEIEENLRRHDMDWKEICCGMVEIHALYQKNAHLSGAKWGQAQTGALLNVSEGHYSYSAKIAKLILAGDKEIIACNSLNDTRIVLLARKQDEARAELAKRTGHVVSTVKKLTGKKSDIPVGDLPPSVLREQAKSLMAEPAHRSTPSLQKLLKKLAEGEISHHKVKISDKILNMDNKDWFAQQKPESYDGICTDIPYGIDMDNLDMADISRVEGEHDVEENIGQMQQFAHNCYGLLKQDRYGFIWYDIKHQEKLVGWFEEAGFAVQPYPLLWIKTHECKNRAAHKWWTKAVEYVLVVAKGKATISKPQAVNWFSCSGKAERKMQNNPFAKPFDFTQWLLSPIILPGQKWADPYAGEGSLVRAMLNLGLDVTAVEKKKIHYDGLLEHVKKHYRQSLSGEVEFV